MSETNDYRIQHKREYHRKWRAEHPESVRAAQVRYWTKKIEAMRADAGSCDNDENGEDDHE